MLKKTPLVSVLIPMFNVEPYIEKALLSITRQTYSNLEVIIVDDYSSDLSVEIVNSFISCHCDLDFKFFINDKNMGVSFVRNKLVGNALGDLLVFLDSDDYFDNDAIEYLVDLIHYNKTSIGQSLYYSESPGGKTVGQTNDFFSTQPLQGKEAVFAMLEGKITGYLWHKIFSKELFENINFDLNLPVFEDYEVIMKMFINGASISFGNERKYHYIQHPMSLTKQSFKNALNRLIYLERTKLLVSPLVITESDKLRLANHENTVALMVFINAIKYGAPKYNVIKIKHYINSLSYSKLYKLMSLKKIIAVLMLKFFPSFLYLVLKMIFKIKRKIA